MAKQSITHCEERCYYNSAGVQMKIISHHCYLPSLSAHRREKLDRTKLRLVESCDIVLSNVNKANQITLEKAGIVENLSSSASSKFTDI